MKEIFKDIEGYDGLYQVSDLGRVKSLNYNHTGKEKILNNVKNGVGYLQVSLYINGIRKIHKVHRLVCKAFLPNPDNKKEINHKNGIKTDNRLENLEWSTRSENTKHAYAELGRKNPMLGKFGSDNPSSKPVCIYSKSWEFIDEFAGAHEASRITGVDKSNIIKCCKGKYCQAGGYIWKYKNEKL